MKLSGKPRRLNTNTNKGQIIPHILQRNELIRKSFIFGITIDKGSTVCEDSLIRCNPKSSMMQMIVDSLEQGAHGSLISHVIPSSPKSQRF